MADSASRAAARACSSSTVTKALMRGLTAAICRRCASTSSTGEICRSRTMLASKQSEERYGICPSYHGAMFSSRLHWDLQPNRLAHLMAAQRKAGAEILDLTESNPTRANLSYPAAGILAALADEHSLLYDPTPAGMPSARGA